MKRILYTILLIPFFAATLMAQWTVSGKITDAKDGTPLIGATVEEAGTLSGTVTDLEGSYTLNVSSGSAKLIIKYVGYAMQEIGVGDRSVIDVLMSEDGIMLEQVVVVGYGVQRKSDVTGSISSVKGKEIEKIATSNIEQALQGKVAGLHVTPASGNPGAGAVIRIRGTGTLNNANPLYVIDGMITYDASLVNPQDVESIEILKDASAAAIYGSRGANGVIIITTKNGRQKKGGQISLSTYYGTQSITREIAMLNGQQFATAYNALRGQNYYPDPSIFGEGTNYQKEIFREAPIYNVQVAASGGNEQTTYNFSANYFDQDGILKNTSFKRGTFRLNTDTKLNPWLTFGNNLSFLISKSQNGPNVVSSAYRMPSVLSPYTEDG
ncbi:MAG TPA: SusC/RagA family TonB-linked outer membrane protein, partial [Saprospiraceae bacterium]|nr:SusC/RagA family TonB-linked outer membrane protein [Saprospiraceae bacterium]